MSDEPPAGDRRRIAVPGPLAGAFARLTHADEHFDALGREIRAYLERHKMGLAPNHEDGWQVVRVASLPRPPMEWGVILGDGLHDCRCPRSITP